MISGYWQVKATARDGEVIWMPFPFREREDALRHAEGLNRMGDGFFYSVVWQDMGAAKAKGMAG